jgi:hypothetical protein
MAGSGLLAVVRRGSQALRRAVTMILLAVAYFTVVPWLWLVRRAAPRRRGWRAREDRAVMTGRRLRQPF